MTRDGKKAQDYANRHDIIKYYTDADAFINDPDIDATYEALK
jgi:predicted dehydrogenase